jgi:hypothetical protein
VVLREKWKDISASFVCLMNQEIEIRQLEALNFLNAVIKLQVP